MAITGLDERGRAPFNDPSRMKSRTFLFNHLFGRPDGCRWFLAILRYLGETGITCERLRPIMGNTNCISSKGSSGDDRFRRRRLGAPVRHRGNGVGYGCKPGTTPCEPSWGSTLLFGPFESASRTRCCTGNVVDEVGGQQGFGGGRASGWMPDRISQSLGSRGVCFPPSTRAICSFQPPPHIPPQQDPPHMQNTTPRAIPPLGLNLSPTTVPTPAGASSRWTALNAKSCSPSSPDADAIGSPCSEFGILSDQSGKTVATP